MTPDKIIIGLVSLGGMAFTYWFFLMKKEKVTPVLNSVDIIVYGGYSPETIAIHENEPTVLNFIRRDADPCLEEVVISDFKIRKYLPMNQKVTIILTPQRSGKFDISCGMNMFHGEIIVSH